jgi:hypothetical protein
MFSGPLSDRIDCITEKPQWQGQMKPRKKKPALALLFYKKPQGEGKYNQELWEATQVNCPVPPRCPDPWIYQ